jgi:hypothetical protein
MRVMVTGGTGYVGAWSVKALVDAGHKVRLLVRDPAKAHATLAALGLPACCDCVVGDMTDEVAVLKALKRLRRGAALRRRGLHRRQARRRDDGRQPARRRTRDRPRGTLGSRSDRPRLERRRAAAPRAMDRTDDRACLWARSAAAYARSKAAAEDASCASLAGPGRTRSSSPTRAASPGRPPARVIGEATQGIASNLKAIGSLPTPRRRLVAHRRTRPGRDPRRADGAGPGAAALHVRRNHYLRMEATRRRSSAALTGRAFKVMPLPGALLRGLGLGGRRNGRAWCRSTRCSPTKPWSASRSNAAQRRHGGASRSGHALPQGRRRRCAKRSSRRAAPGCSSEEQIGKLASARSRRAKSPPSPKRGCSALPFVLWAAWLTAVPLPVLGHLFGQNWLTPWPWRSACCRWPTQLVGKAFRCNPDSRNRILPSDRRWRCCSFNLYAYVPVHLALIAWGAGRSFAGGSLSAGQALGL